MTDRLYSDTARIVWNGAFQGRRAARCGYRSIAFIIAEPLRAFDDASLPLLMRTAHEAGRDIERLLYGVNLEAEKRDNVTTVNFTVASVLNTIEREMKVAS